MEDNGRVLAIGAHPDDVEFKAAGTLSLLRKNGYEITIVTVANGDCGSTEHSAVEIARIRKGEATESAALLQGRYFGLDAGDLAISFDMETRRKVTNAIREVDPFLVFTHPHEDYMADHEVTSRLVRDACFGAPIPNYGGYGNLPHTSGIPTLYYWDAMEGIDYLGRPQPVHFYVDVTSEMDVKRQMLACHRSQSEWLMRQHGLDHYVNSMEHWGEERGKEAGFQYAEGFCQHRGHAYPKDNVLAKLLGEDKVKAVR
ncbi:MAG TPA: PIG-L family deacetylase [Planctomycetota bacterium]|nr:PIG-L family deacetylase [Planctomycetota bacterium]